MEVRDECEHLERHSQLSRLHRQSWQLPLHTAWLITAAAGARHIPRFQSDSQAEPGTKVRNHRALQGRHHTCFAEARGEI